MRATRPAASRGFARAHQRRTALAEFAADVRTGLRRTPKTLPSKYLYDALGSALFDAITELPEYGLTRAEERILVGQAHAIAARLPHRVVVAELGAGSGRKTVPLLEALLTRQTTVSYAAIDLSASAQERCARLLAELRGVTFEAIEAGYLQGLARFNVGRAPQVPMLLLFLGSSIGNFDAREQRAFLRAARALMREGDALLLGVDLVQPAEHILAAYDDPLGVTAAFDLNLLGRINRELGADFDLSAFRHEVLWSESERRVEMHLRSLRAQSVRIPGAACRVQLAPGETIWTESSHKFVPDDLQALATSAGFVEAARFLDETWPFADILWLARGKLPRNEGTPE